MFTISRDCAPREAREGILKIAPRILPAKALDQIRDKVVRLFEDTRRFEQTESSSSQVSVFLR